MSGIQGPWRLRGVLIGQSAPRATALMRRQDGPGSACTAPSAPGTKASPRAANQLRTKIAPKRADEGGRDHVADEMRRDDDAAHRDHHGEDQHRDRVPSATAPRSRPPPRRPWSNARTAGSRIRAATTTAHRRTVRTSEGRTRPISPLMIVTSSPGTRDRQKQIVAAAPPGSPAPDWRCARRSARQAAASTIRPASGRRNQPDSAVVGDLVEGVDQPGRQRAGEHDGARVDERHRDADQHDAGNGAEREPPRRRQQPARLEAPRTDDQRQPGGEICRDAAQPRSACALTPMLMLTAAAPSDRSRRISPCRH